MAETIPLEFTAVDNLTKAVSKMTEMLEQMSQAETQVAKAADETTDATEKQSQATSRFGRVLDTLSRNYDKFSQGLSGVSEGFGSFREKLETAYYVVELSKAGLEALSGLYGSISERITTANEKWDEQSKKLGKAASGLGSIAETTAKVKKAQDGLYASLGKVIDRSSILQTLNLAQERVLKSLKKYIDDNAESWAKYLNQLGQDGLNKLISFGALIEENASTLARLNLALSATAQLVGFTIKSFVLIGQTIYTALTEPIADAAETISQFLAVTSFLTDDKKLSASLLSAANAFDKIKQSAKSAQTEGIVGIRETVQELTGDAVALTSTLQNVFADDAGIEGYIKRYERLGKFIQDTSKAIKRDLQTGIEEDGKTRTDLDPMEGRELGLQDYGKIWSEVIKTASDNVKQARREEAELEDLAWRERIAREEEEDAKRKERFDITMANIKSREEAEIAAIENISSSISDTFANIPNLIDGVSESTQRMFNGFSQAALKVGDLSKAFKAYNAVGATAKQQQDAINAGISAGAGVLSSVTQSFIEDKRKQAAIEALINAAAAAASYATGNIPAGIAYTAAAVSYGAAAAFSGGGSSGGNIGASAGAAQGSSSPSMVNLDQERRQNAEAIAEAFREAENNRSVTINLSFDNALIASDSPQAARVITDLITPELQQILRSN